MLLNPGFEVGKWYHKVDHRFEKDDVRFGPIQEMAIPNGWELEYALSPIKDDFFYHPTESTPLLPNQTQGYGRPEVVTWLNDDFGPDFQHFYAWRNGVYTLKIFTAFYPVWWRLHQNVSRLTPGESYLFLAPIFQELISHYNPTIVAPDKLSGEIRVSVGQDIENPRLTTGWLNGNQTPFMKWNILKLPFVAEDDQERVHVEGRAPWGLDNVAFYLDGLSLRRDAHLDDKQTPGNNEYDIFDEIENNLESIEGHVGGISGLVKNLREFGGDSDGSDA